MNKAKFRLMLVSFGAAVIMGCPAAHSQSGVVHTGPQPAAASITSYWTPERMKAAQPRDVGPGQPAPPTHSSAPLPSGSPGAAGGTLPTVAGAGEAPLASTPKPHSLLSRPKQASTVVPSSGPFPGPNATYAYAPRFRTYPISTVGVLFFTEPGVGNFLCTATVTTGSASILNIVWTAGHCVANGGHSQFFTNWLFCPSYDNNQGGVNPALGCWAGIGAAVPTAWYANGSFSRDFAYVALASSGTLINNNVANVTGSLGFAWNWAVDQAWHHYGYPAQSPWTFGEIVATTTEYRYSVTMDADGPPVNSWGTGQTPGSSGSALILFFSYGGGLINSNVSFYFSSGPNGNEYGIESQGPYYDTFACQVWKGATAWPGTC